MMPKKKGTPPVLGQAGHATAPYNFVSLPQGVLTVPIEGGRGDEEECERAQQSYRAHVLAPGRLSGHIALTIATKTAVFIGAEEGADFFAPCGTPVIPGSSLRGMIKNLFKIVTCGAMRSGEDYHDHTLYFRTMAGSNAGMRGLYSKEMSCTESTDGKQDSTRTNADPGYLIQQKDDRRYYICPAEYRVEPDKKDGSKYNTVDWDLPQRGEASCYTGPMQGKASYTVHYAPRWGERIPVPEEVVQAYREDISRKGVDLLDKKDKNGNDKIFLAREGQAAAEFTGNSDITFVVPCFYRQEKEGEIRHFGFGRFYRIPYRSSISDHVLGMDCAGFDYADALFGCKELWASRLSFTDALPETEVQMESAAYPCVLSEPKPTSIQLYLEQETKSGELAHWDTKYVPIRGYKLYWHQKNSPAWRNPEQKETNVVKSRITPVKAGTRFYAGIRFERLSEDELGALLKTLQITGKQLCCKIGKGKSLGLGSVQIKPTLFLINTSDTYRRAFDAAGGWNTAEREASEEEVQSYKTAFDEILEERLSDETKKRYKSAVSELKCLLDWGRSQNPTWNEKIAQMTIGQGDKRFQERAILPCALDVK